MKKLLALAGLLVSAFAGSLAFTAPAHAAFACTTPTVSGGAYPQNYLWFCEDTAVAPLQALTKTQSTDALRRLGNNSTSASDAKTQMATNLHHVYIFKSYSDYQNYCTANGNNGATPPVPKCFTFTDIANSQKWDDSGTIKQQSIIIEDDVLAEVKTNIGNTTGHEAGHQLDGIYGDVIYTPADVDNYASKFGREYAFKLTGETVTFTGSSTTPGTVLTLGFEPATGSPITKSYTVIMGDTTTSIATTFQNLINADTGLQALGVTATSSGASVKVYSDTILKYTKTGNGITLSSYDWQEFITNVTPQCGRSQGIFKGFKDNNGNQICGSLQQGVVGGTSFINEFIYLEVTDASINGGAPHSVAGPVGAGLTTTQIAAGLATAINNDVTLNPGSPKNITATSSGANVYITSSTGNMTTYSFHVSGTHETFAASGGTVAGSGEQPMNTYAGLRNDQVLQQAWSYYFQPQTIGGNKYWAELFAEQSSIRAGQIMSGSQTPDNWLGSGEFICSNKVVEKLGVGGALPVPTDYATQCK